jgi:hypothetical protein
MPALRFDGVREQFRVRRKAIVGREREKRGR